VQSLLAVAGTMLLCACQLSIGTRLTRVAENRVIQHVGRTSYSWYLWHWPIVAFYYVAYGTLPTLASGLACIIMGYALGWLSYEKFERGNQKKSWLSGAWRPIGVLATLAVSCIVIGAAALVTNGAMFRYPAATANLLRAQMDRSDGRCSFVQRLRDYQAEICRIGSARGAGGLLVVGDSHAAKAKDALRKIAEGQHIPIYLTKRNCRPTELAPKGYCSVKWWDRVVKDARAAGITRLVVIAHYDVATTDDAYESGFARAAGAGIPVFLQASPPEGSWFDPASRIDPSPGSDASPDRTVAGYRAERAGQIRALLHVAQTYRNVTVLDPIPYLCPRGECQRDFDGHPLYSDAHHLSSIGVQRIVPIYAPLFGSGSPPR
jgi:hypothetical protein